MKAKKYLYSICALIAFLMFFANVENVKSSVRSAAIFCFESLFPSLFPFMIILSIILYTKGFEPFFEILPRKVFNILGVCQKHACIILASSLCGFINGPKILSDDYRKNGGDENEFSNSVILSSNAGIVFLSVCLGGAIWGSLQYGLFLFFAQIFCAFLLGKILLKHKSEYSFNDSYSKKTINSKVSFSNAFSNAVTSSALTMISICAFVIFFSAITRILTIYLNLDENSVGSAIINILAEFCQGSYKIINFSSRYLSAFFSGFCIGFGGLCVHFQTFAICEGCPLNKKKFVMFKFLHGITCGICSLFYIIVTNISPRNSIEAVNYMYYSNLQISSISSKILLFIILFLFVKKIFSKIVLIFK